MPASNSYDDTVHGTRYTVYTIVDYRLSLARYASMARGANSGAHVTAAAMRRLGDRFQSDVHTYIRIYVYSVLGYTFIPRIFINPPERE